MILYLTELSSGKSLTLVVSTFAVREPLPDETTREARSKILTEFGDFFVRETPEEILHQMNRK